MKRSHDQTERRSLHFSLQELVGLLTLACAALAVGKFSVWILLCVLPILICLSCWIRKDSRIGGAAFASALAVTLFVYCATWVYPSLGSITIFVQAGWLYWFIRRNVESTLGRFATVVWAGMYGAVVMILHLYATQSV